MSLIYLALISEESEAKRSYTGYVGPDDLTGQNRRLVCLGTDEAETPNGVVTIMRLSPKEMTSAELMSIPMFRQMLGWKCLLDEGWKQVSTEQAAKMLGRPPSA